MIDSTLSQVLRIRLELLLDIDLQDLVEYFQDYLDDDCFVQYLNVQMDLNLTEVIHPWISSEIDRLI